MNDSQPRAALESLRELTAAANRLIDASAPFKLAKLLDDEAAQRRVDAVLAACAETCRTLALLLGPVLPVASGKMLEQLNYIPPTDGDGLALAADWGSPGGRPCGRRAFPRCSRGSKRPPLRSPRASPGGRQRPVPVLPHRLQAVAVT